MKRAAVFVALIFVLALAACSSEPDPADIRAGVQTAIAQTEAASSPETEAPEPVNTAMPTEAPKPTETPLPTATTTPESCTTQAADSLAELDSIMVVWEDANALANQTARIALSEQIATLQEIKRQAASLDVPECATDAFDLLPQYMDSIIESYLAFMGEDDFQTDLYLLIAEHQLSAFINALESLDLEEGDSKIQVHYYLDGDWASAVTIQYWENGEEIEVKEQFPWSYAFEAKPDDFLSVYAGFADVCVILADGQLIEVYRGPSARCSEKVEE